MSNEVLEAKFRIVDEASNIGEDSAQVVVEGPTRQDMLEEACKSFVLKEIRKKGFPAYAITSLFPQVYPVDENGKEVMPIGPDGTTKVKAWRAVYEVCSWR